MSWLRFSLNVELGPLDPDPPAERDAAVDALVDRPDPHTPRIGFCPPNDPTRHDPEDPPMKRERTLLEVIVDLDPTPGTMHTTESAARSVQAVLLGRYPVQRFRPESQRLGQVVTLGQSLAQLPGLYGAEWWAGRGQ